MKKPQCFPIHGDCLDEMRRMIREGVQFDSAVMDPPYHLLSIVKRFGGKNAAPALEGTDGAFKRSSAAFMGKNWDGGDIAFRRETWELVFQLLKPGGYLLAFNHTTTYHRMAVAIEDAGFQIRDMIDWVYGSGFPKNKCAMKAIDRAFPQRHATALQWEGWGTTLKPSKEPVCMARKPLDGTMAANLIKHGVGAMNIAGCRIGDRYPPNLVHDGSAEVERVFESYAPGEENPARFFYSAKADASERVFHCTAGCDYRVAGVSGGACTCGADMAGHPTVKPLDLMAWLCRLVTPPGGHVLDCFGGSGSTGIAAMREGFDCTLIEKDEESYKDILHRLKHVKGTDTPLFSALDEAQGNLL